MGTTSSTQADLDGDAAVDKGCRPLLCCGKGKQRPGASTSQRMDMWRGSADSEVEATPGCGCWDFWRGSSVSEQDQEALLEKQRQAVRRKAAMGGAACLALVAGVCAVVLGVRFWPHKKVRAPTKAYVAASQQFAADVARGECDYAVPEGEGICFCQLAGSKHCNGQACACSQGCDGDVLRSPRSVTFANLGQAGECEETTALLTIPKSYFEHIDFLLQWCPTASHSLLIELMESGFNNYQEQVAKGPVKQCVHAAKMISIPWLHVHTFCPDGLMDGMQETGKNGWCGTIQDVTEVPGMVDELVAWALDGDALRDTTNFASCHSIGCGQDVPKPACSCTKDCLKGKNVTCCEDFSESCEF